MKSAGATFAQLATVTGGSSGEDSISSERDDKHKSNEARDR